MFRGGVENVTGPSKSVNHSSVDGRLLLLCLFAWVLLRTLMVAGVDLSKDEAVYWHWSQNLNASYAWLPFAAIWLGDFVGAGSDLFLRLPFVAAGVVSALLLYHLCRLRGLPPGRAAIAVAAFATSHWIWHTSSFLHPDGFLVPAWLAVLVCSERASRGDGEGWWWAAGAGAGLAALSKYSGLVLSAGLFAWLLVLAIRGRRGPLLRAGIPFVLLSCPVLIDLLATNFSLPSALNTLSAVAPDSLPVRLGMFLGAPLFYVSPLLLATLYRGVWKAGRDWRRLTNLTSQTGQHLLWPGAALICCFCFFTLTRGQVKGNWILPALLGVWPLAFSASWLQSRVFTVALLAFGISMAAIPAIALRWPAVADWLSHSALGSLNSSYTSIVSQWDLPREPTFSWTERVCEYHGWGDFGRKLDDLIVQHDLPAPLTIASTEYGLAFGAVRYARLVNAVALPGDPRFVRIAAPPAEAVLDLARVEQPPSQGGKRLAIIERFSKGCEPLRYAVYETVPEPPATGVGAFSADGDRADASRR